MLMYGTSLKIKGKVRVITCIVKKQRMEQVRRVWPAYHPDTDPEVSLVSRQRGPEQQAQGPAGVHPRDAALAASEVHRGHCALSRCS